MKIFDMKDYIPSPKELENRELAYNIVDDRLSLKVDSGLVIDILEVEENVENNVISGFKNILINGDMRINQRSFDGDWTGVPDWTFGYDGWGKYETGEYIYQGIEEGDYKPDTIYTLSGTNITTQQATSPSSGTWWIGSYDYFTQVIPTSATNIQLEEGVVATAFELRPIGLELSLCQRYYLAGTGSGLMVYGGGGTNTTMNLISFPVTMHDIPTITVNLTWHNGSGTKGSLTAANATPNNIRPDWSWTSGGTDGTVFVGSLSFTASAELT